jgi:hypothetical protein
MTLAVGQEVWVVGLGWDFSIPERVAIRHAPEKRFVVSTDGKKACLLDTWRNNHIEFRPVGEICPTEDQAWVAANAKEQEAGRR